MLIARLQKARPAVILTLLVSQRRKIALSRFVDLWESLDGSNSPESIDVFFRAVDILDKWAQVDQGKGSQESADVMAEFTLMLARKVSSPRKTTLTLLVPVVPGYSQFESKLLPEINFDVFGPTLKDCLEGWMVLASQEQLFRLSKGTYEKAIVGGRCAILDDRLSRWERNRLSACLLLWAVDPGAQNQENHLSNSEGIVDFLVRTLARLQPICQPWSQDTWVEAAEEVQRRVGLFVPKVSLSAVSWDLFKQRLGDSNYSNC
jgi:hypothetical protein